MQTFIYKQVVHCKPCNISLSGLKLFLQNFQLYLNEIISILHSYVFTLAVAVSTVYIVHTFTQVHMSRQERRLKTSLNSN